MSEAVVLFTVNVHDGKAGPEGWEVESDMTGGSGLGATVLGPIQTTIDPVDGGRLHNMVQALEAEGELCTVACPAARLQWLQMPQDVPERLLGPERVTVVIGMEDGVFAGGSHGTDRRHWPRVEPEGIAALVETVEIGQLGIERTDAMTLRTKCSRLRGHIRGVWQVRQQMMGNQMVGWGQECGTTASYLGTGFVLDDLLGGRFGRLKATSFLPQDLQSPKPVGLR